MTDAIRETRTEYVVQQKHKSDGNWDDFSPEDEGQCRKRCSDLRRWKGHMGYEFRAVKRKITEEVIDP